MDLSMESKFRGSLLGLAYADALGTMVGAIYGEEWLYDDIDKIHGYAGEKFEHVTYEDMVNTIDALL